MQQIMLSEQRTLEVEGHRTVRPWVGFLYLGRDATLRLQFSPDEARRIGAALIDESEHAAS